MALLDDADSLARLRALAQQHLKDIAQEEVKEQTQASKAEEEIQRYAKISAIDRKQRSKSSKDRSESPSGDSCFVSTSQYDEKKDRFRPFDEVLHRLRWDPDLNIEEYVVGYLERFDGIKEMPASNWIKDFSEEEWIPMHRVRYVKRTYVSVLNNSASTSPGLGIVWDRDERTDKLSREAIVP